MNKLYTWFCWLRLPLLCLTLFLAACGDDEFAPPDGVLVHYYQLEEEESGLNCGWMKQHSFEVDSTYGWPRILGWDATNCEWAEADSEHLVLDCWSLGTSFVYGAYTASVLLELNKHGNRMTGSLSQSISIDNQNRSCSASWIADAWIK